MTKLTFELVLVLALFTFSYSVQKRGDIPFSSSETALVMVTREIDDHIVRCYKQGFIEHPTDLHKYVVCEYISSGPRKGWWIHIMGCAPGTRWTQEKQQCVPFSTTTTQATETASAMVTKVIDGHIFKCYKTGLFEHPSDGHKYIVCEHISSGPSKGWWIHIISCAPGTKWAQEKQHCVSDN